MLLVDTVLVDDGAPSPPPRELWPYEPVAERVWDLRHNLSAYDGWYVALAELLEAPLATADLHLARAPGLRCEVRVPSFG